MTIAVALLVLVLWSSYRLLFPENLLLDEMLLKPLIWLFPVYIVTRFKNLGYSSKNIYKNIIIGLSVGLLLSLERIFVGHLKPEFSFVFILSALFTAITEEIFFRGYLLNRWLRYFKKPYLALILNGLYFTLTHVPIAYFVFHYSGIYLFSYLVANFIFGFVDVILFYKTKSIFAPIANHFVWNVFSGLFK
jgi:membrane protease YdiL (CAAX protease family)